MGRSVLARVIAIIAVIIVFGAIGIYPIVAAHFGITSPSWLMDKQLKLGLDLKGGVHLVVRVQIEDALRLETDAEAEDIRDRMQRNHVPFASIASTSATQFTVSRVPLPQMRHSARPLRTRR
jgi:preprotein translocase subunit SecD